MSPVYDAMSSKYNYGVCLAKIGQNVNYFTYYTEVVMQYIQQAAWVFHDLKAQVECLDKDEARTDFTYETLSMLSRLMMA